MLGAIIGDIVGSRWEFAPTNDYDFELFSEQNSFTDDTICTIAIADAILRGRDYGESLHDWCGRYLKPKGGFGARFRQWVESEHPQPYGSYGNGSAMRVSPIGMWFSGKAVDEEAERSAVCTHNHPFGIKGAQCIASAVNAALDIGDGLKSHPEMSKEILDMCVVCCNDYGFASCIDLDDYRNRFDETCQGTIPPAFEILNFADDFEDAIRRAVCLGADADTLAAIVGSVAEHLWGIPEWMKARAMEYLTPEMRRVVFDFYAALEGREDYKPLRKELRSQQALMHWKLGAGHMGRAFEGMDPMPPKDRAAKAEDWQVEDMPPGSAEWVCADFWLSPDEMALLRRGHIPEAQEDHWFMFCDGERIRYFRSWTGICALEGFYRLEEGRYHVTSVRVNRQLGEFGVNGKGPACELFRYLVCCDAGGDGVSSWQSFIEAWEEQERSNIEADEERAQEQAKLFDLAAAVGKQEIQAMLEPWCDRSFAAPEKVDRLDEGEVFVFGSNSQGHHDSGAAMAALKRFGAVYGQGEGLQGRSYAICASEGLVVLARSINGFLDFARSHPEKMFLVTAVGCGKAGFNAMQVAPLFRPALLLPNVRLPRLFYEYFRLTACPALLDFTPSPIWKEWGCKGLLPEA